MSNDFLNKIEDVDLQINEIFLNATCEDNIRDAISETLLFETLGAMRMIRGSYGRNRRDDGVIYYKGIPVGRNESKFMNFAGSIYGNKLNAMFAQAIAYYSLDKNRDTHKFIWLSHNEWIVLINIADNKELIQELLNLYTEKITPCTAYNTPGIGKIFSRIPLVKHRCWKINNNFKFSEVIEETLKIIEE